jgi:hypothetical protein
MLVDPQPLIDSSVFHRLRCRSFPAACLQLSRRDDLHRRGGLALLAADLLDRLHDIHALNDLAEHDLSTARATEEQKVDDQWLLASAARRGETRVCRVVSCHATDVSAIQPSGLGLKERERETKPTHKSAASQHRRN